MFIITFVMFDHVSATIISNCYRVLDQQRFVTPGSGLFLTEPLYHSMHWLTAPHEFSVTMHVDYSMVYQANCRNQRIW